MWYLGFHLTPLVDSSSLSVVFIIGYYSESLCHALFHLVHVQSHTSVWSLQYFHPSPSKYLAFCYSSCWMMGDALIPSFQWISSYRLQHILLWDRDLESFLVPWGLQSSVVGSLTIDSGNTSMSLIGRFYQVFNINSFIHTC
jgi:hypothetical protein